MLGMTRTNFRLTLLVVNSLMLILKLLWSTLWQRISSFPLKFVTLH